MGLRQIKHLPQSPFTGHFLDNDIGNCILSVYNLSTQGSDSSLPYLRQLCPRILPLSSSFSTLCSKYSIDACLRRQEKDGWSQTGVSTMSVVFFHLCQYQLFLSFGSPTSSTFGDMFSLNALEEGLMYPYAFDLCLVF